jgi:hypothetical protein
MLCRRVLPLSSRLLTHTFLPSPNARRLVVASPTKHALNWQHNKQYTTKAKIIDCSNVGITGLKFQHSYLDATQQEKLLEELYNLIHMFGK